MNRLIIFRPAARDEFLAACEWYEQRRAGLGDRLEASVERTLELIASSPEAFPVLHRNVRRALVRPFPYGIFYRVGPESIDVLAVMHGSRDPDIWKSGAEED